MERLTVSVFVITYNHEDYIEKALESILMQETNFDYEIVVGEDCSTDNTRKILLEYKKKHPKKFKLLLHEKNIGAMQNQIKTMDACTGKYIAICEGDDYWVSPHKLQKQVNFLESNPSYNICGHSVQCSVPSIFSKKMIFKKDQRINLKKVIYTNCVHTSSFLFRNIQKHEGYDDFFNKVSNGDFPILVYYSQDKGIYVFKEKMSVYRTDNPDSIWIGKLEKGQRLRWKENTVSVMASSPIFSKRARKYLSRGTDGKEAFIFNVFIKRFYRRINRRIKNLFKR